MWMSSPFGSSRAAQSTPTWHAPAPEDELADVEPGVGSPPGMPSEDVDARAHERTDELAQLRRELDELKRSVLQRDDEPRPGPARRPRKRKTR
jgi:hypothetical protein